VFAGLSEEGAGAEGFAGAMPERGGEGEVCGVSFAGVRRESRNSKGADAGGNCPDQKR
jgi:hypothetical protein